MPKLDVRGQGSLALDTVGPAVDEVPLSVSGHAGHSEESNVVGTFVDAQQVRMTTQHALKSRADLTFKANLARTRYGWLRLTPAYSVHLVAEIVREHCTRESVVLDPFCGTGTTALVCAEHGIACDTTDINPFLLWLAEAKSRRYSAAELVRVETASAAVIRAIHATSKSPEWIPPLHQIEKWWNESTLHALGRAFAAIKHVAEGEQASVVDLLKVIFCRTMIAYSNASFGHQSMSFKKTDAHPTLALVGSAADGIAVSWRKTTSEIVSAAASEIAEVPRHLHCDARNLRVALPQSRYDCVVTSPPYPNRMSYIRELRPYMYWLGYLADGRAAGELDWQAIGGTWGCATSNVGKWRPDPGSVVPSDGFGETLDCIAAKSPLLSNYVRKYFHDMVDHCEGLYAVAKPGATIHYIVGNSKFYDTMLHVETIFAHLFAHAGFRDTSVKAIRKRTSKKELFEFVVSARKPIHT